MISEHLKGFFQMKVSDGIADNRKQNIEFWFC